MEIESKQPFDSAQAKQILERRKEIEQELMALIGKIGGGFSVEEVKDMIFDEENRDLRLVSDAWNYFPHKVLGGISPAEKLLEYHNKTKK